VKKCSDSVKKSYVKGSELKRGRNFVKRSKLNTSK